MGSRGSASAARGLSQKLPPGRMRRMRALHLRIASLAFFLVAGALVTDGAGADEPKPLNHEWREIGTNHWQIKTAAGEAPETTDAAEGNRGTCSAGMVDVKGKFRLTEMGDEIQKSICSKWINREFPERCASFDKDKWAALRAKM